MVEPKPYAAAQMTLVDRDSEKESAFYCYPITEIILVSQDTAITRRFVPNDNGVWEEVNIS